MYIRKLLCTAFCVAAMGITFASCDDDRNEVRYDVIELPDQLLSEGITASTDGETKTFFVKSTSPVTLRLEKIDENDDLSWINATIGSKTAEGYPVTITVDPNTTTSERKARVAIFATNTARGITVAQPTTFVPADPSENMKSNAKQLASKMYAGVNIGNTMEAPDGEGSWGTGKVNYGYIKGLKALGFNAVRIPCAWDSHVSNPASNTIDPAWLDRVDEVVSWIVSEDMYAILNIHWDGGWLENHVGDGFNEDIDKKQRDYWTQIANKLNKYDEHLLFAGMNEPGMDGTITDVAVDAIVKYQQTFVDAVRATGGNNATRCLIAQGPQTNIDETVKSRYKLPVDAVPDRMIVEIHNYDPSDFTIMEKDGQWSSKVKLYWGADNFVAGSDRNSTWADENYINNQFKKMHDTFVTKGYPVIVGEYSSSIRKPSDFPGMDEEKHKKSRAYWNEVLTRSAKNNGCVPFYWETGGDINRADGTAINQYAIDGIMTGASTGVYPF